MIFASGCVEFILSDITPAVNCEPLPDPERTPVAQSETALLATESGVGDLQWLQIDRPSQAGTVGGYYAAGNNSRGSLIILLTGASTLEPAGRRTAALKLYNGYGFRFQREGFSVWSLVLSEDTPYGAEEVTEVVDVIDWLDGEGREFLGVERVYIVGYSAGATTTNLVNLQRDVTAVVSLGGLTRGDQYQANAVIYRMITDLFPCNTGMGQLRQTIDAYGGLDQDPMDVVSRVAEIRNPTLFVHTLDDIVHDVSNPQALERAYREELATGNQALPVLTFRYYPRGGHLSHVRDPDLYPPVIEYLNTFEP